MPEGTERLAGVAVASTVNQIGALARNRTSIFPFRRRTPCPLDHESMEMQAGVEPAHGGFADRRVPVSPLHQFVLAHILLGKPGSIPDQKSRGQAFPGYALKGTS